MASLTILVDISACEDFMRDWETATAQLDDVPDYLWERMQALQDITYYIDSGRYECAAVTARYSNGVIIVEPTPEALSVLATLRALGT